MTQEKNILDPIVLTQLRQALTSWQEQELATFTARQPESKQEYRSACIWSSSDLPSLKCVGGVERRIDAL
jgi:hypothetical protein